MLRGPVRAGLLLVLLIALHCVESKSLSPLKKKGNVSNLKKKAADTTRDSALRKLKSLALKNEQFRRLLEQSLSEPKAKRQDDPACPGPLVLIDDEGSITSPGHDQGNKYPNNVNCSWEIRAPQGKIVSAYASFLDIEEGGDDCDYDKLIIDDGDGPRNYCSGVEPEIIESRGNQLRVRFTSDGSVRAQGFKLQYVILDSPAPPDGNGGSGTGGDGCEGTQMLSGASGEVMSPNHGNGNYPNNAECGYLIEVPEGRVRLTLEEVNIEFEDSCGYDALEIYDGSSDNAERLDVICGNTVGTHLSSGSQMFLKFYSDESVTDTGFRATYEAVTGTSACDATRPASLEGTSGEFRSPDGGSGTYPDNAHCEWKITVPAGQLVRLSFTSFAVEAEDACGYDVVRVYDGDSTGAAEVLTHCGSNVPSDVVSSGNVLYVKFTSDDSVTEAGFIAEYRADDDNGGESDPCGDSRPAALEGTEGSLASPVGDNGKYGNDATCEWRITVPSGMRAHLHFDSFVLEGGGTSCPYDHVQIYDGGSDGASLLGRHCGTDIPGDITATSNLLYVKFTSDDSVTKAGFRAEYSAKDDNGGGGGGGDGEPECGIPVVLPKTRIVGGTEATPHSWPWQISMRNPDYWHFCGGSIISKRWIVTAAHCVSDGSAEGITVMVGDHDRNSDSNDGETRIAVSRVIVHENYDSGSYQLDNDIALLELAEDVPYGDHVKPVCLPSNDPPVDQECTITGWGNTEDTGDEKLLQQAKVPIMSHSECDGSYPGEISQQMVCAGYEEGGKDSCQGDSGGPLVCRPQGVYVLQGVTSWGYGCADAGHPGVYARVARLVDWIQSNTNNAGQIA